VRGAFVRLALGFPVLKVGEGFCLCRVVVLVVLHQAG
jgi:hypothetical protein